MLHRLVQYARDQQLISEPGFKPKQARWAIVIDKKGAYRGVKELGDTEARRNLGQTFSMCPDLSQPELKALGRGARHFLLDNVEVVTLFSETPKDAKLLAKHEFFKTLLRQASEAMPELGAIADLLDDSSRLSEIRAELTRGKAQETENITFFVQARSPAFLIDDGKLRDIDICGDDRSYI